MPILGTATQTKLFEGFMHISFLVKQRGFEFFVYVKCHVLQHIEHG